MFGEVVPSGAERLQVQFLGAGRDRVLDCILPLLSCDQIGDGGEETQHDDVLHDHASDLLGDARGGDAVDRLSLLGGGFHQVLLVDEDAVVVQVVLVLLVPVAGHSHEDVELLQVGIEHFAIGEHKRGAAGRTPRLGAEALDHGGLVAGVDGIGVADDVPRENDTLAAEAGDTDFLPTHGSTLPPAAWGRICRRGPSRNARACSR